MTLYLWHQSAFLAVTTAGLAFGRLPGLLTAPSSLLWVAERVAWLPVFAAALALLWVVFHKAERPRRRPAGALTGRPGRREPGPGQHAGAEAGHRADLPAGEGEHHHAAGVRGPGLTAHLAAPAGPIPPGGR
jgi:hypothetical protein